MPGLFLLYLYYPTQIILFLMASRVPTMTSYLTQGCFRAVSEPPASLLPTHTTSESTSNGFPPSEDDLLSNPQFAGLFQTLSLDKDDVPSATEVVDDYEGEQKMLDLQNSAGNSDNTGEDDTDDNDNGDHEEEAGDKASVGFSGLKDVVKNASKELQKEQTLNTEGMSMIMIICLFCWSVRVSDCYVLAKWPSAFSSWL
jgi:hypothetical protein